MRIQKRKGENYSRMELAGQEEVVLKGFLNAKWPLVALFYRNREPLR